MPGLFLRHWGEWTGRVLACGLLVAPALAGPDLPPGDGSDVTNARLLPDYYPEDGGLVLEGVGPSGLREPYDPYFDVDWSVSLRGSYSRTETDESFDIITAPEVTLTHTGSRSSLTATAGADVTQPLDGQIDVTGLRLGLEAGYALDSVTTLSANANLDLSQDLPGTPGLASDELQGPETFEASLGLGVERQFGRFKVGLTGAAARFTYGPTTLVDGTSVDNADQDYWGLDTTLRVGYQATPIFEVFAEGGLGRELFDQPSTTLLVRPDATTTTLRAGVVGRWNEILEAEVSTGIGLRRFDAAELGEVTSRLYDARVTFTPDPTWRFTAALSTTMAPPGPDEAGATRTEYLATGTVDYTVNSWLALRALASWHTDRIDGDMDGESGYELGGGADYKVNAHTDLSADYQYTSTQSPGSDVETDHRVTLGVTLAR